MKKIAIIPYVKILPSAILYTCEQDKINYIRDYCKDTAFEIIKAKANSIFANSYLTFSQMIQDLENIFNKFNQVVKFDAFFQDFKFEIAVANLKKTFDKFFARFNLAIIYLDFINCHKISNLQKTLIKHLCFKMTDSTIYIIFSQYISCCRQCNPDFCQADRLMNQN